MKNSNSEYSLKSMFVSTKLFNSKDNKYYLMSDNIYF